MAIGKGLLRYRETTKKWAQREEEKFCLWEGSSRGLAFIMVKNSGAMFQEKWGPSNSASQ
jgi:hypothetical protein